MFWSARGKIREHKYQMHHDSMVQLTKSVNQLIYSIASGKPARENNGKAICTRYQRALLDYGVRLRILNLVSLLLAKS